MKVIHEKGNKIVSVTYAYVVIKIKVRNVSQF